MFLGCSPCCGGACPNYYNIVDGADLIELWVQLLYLDGSGTTTQKSLFSDQGIIGPSKDVLLDSGVSDLGGNVLLLPQSKSASNGVITLRAYNPDGTASAGILSNYFEVSATSYALSIGGHIREASCWHDWIIREERCLFPDVAWTSTYDLGNLPAKTDHDTAFSQGNGQEYKTKKANCQRLVMYNYSRYDSLPEYQDQQLTHGAYQPQDWSFIFPIVDSWEYNSWLSGLDMGGPQTNYPQYGARYFTHANVGNGRKANTPTNPEDGAYRLQQCVCVRPWESQGFADVYNTHQTRELVKRLYTGIPATARPDRAAESFQIQAAWAWRNGQRTSLMQTQPSFGSKELAWQLHYSSDAAIETADWGSAIPYFSPTRSTKTNRNFLSLNSLPDFPFSGSSYDVCQSMGAPYGWPE